jgi:NAD(P)-dependent dehydrogenase (short-subunit alcohol dehydrogenase family)
MGEVHTMNKEGLLTGRVAIVTGAGQGIGRGIATALAKAGAGVTLVDQALDTMEEAAESIAATGASVRLIQGSVSDRATADRAVAESLGAFGGVGILVNCAHTYTPHASLEAIPEEDFRIELDTGFFGTVHFMQAVFPHMRDGGGSIINFGSQVALHSDPNRATYSATKEAIRALSRTAARDWGKYKIRVNVICPLALTPAIEERVTAEVRAAVEVSTALGYFGDPESDIAPVAVFLASDESRYLTGQTINADGGRWMF